MDFSHWQLVYLPLVLPHDIELAIKKICKTATEITLRCNDVLRCNQIESNKLSLIKKKITLR